jgi:CubicO group peptidase (beta-lactamase class C family)
MTKPLALLLLAASGMLCACSTLSRISVASDTANIQCPLDMARETQQLVQPILASKKASGISIGAHLVDGREVFFGYGRISATNPAAPGPDTVAAVGSLTKGLVGALALRLVEDGKMRWDSPLAAPQFHLTEQASRITLWELATHTSGLPRQPNDFHFFRNFLNYLFTGKDFYRQLDATAAYQYLGKWNKPHPTTEEQYSNLGYALLADQLQTSTGQPLDALLEANVLAPFGMTHTSFNPSTIPGAHMVGHAGDQPKFMRRGTPLDDWVMIPFMRGTGGLYSTTRDMLAYSRHFLAPSSAQPDNVHRVAWHPDPLGNPQVFYQYGVNSGHTTFVGIDTQHQLAVVVMQDTFNWNETIGRELLRRMAVAHAQCQSAMPQQDSTVR